MELNEIDIDETLHDILLNLDLLAFENTIVFDMQLTQLDHFKVFIYLRRKFTESLFFKIKYF